MRRPKLIDKLAAVLLIAASPLGAAQAQFSGFVNLPRDDFTWRWGDWEREVNRRRFSDFEVSGSEAGFRCELTAGLSPSSRLTPNEVRNIEQQLGTSLYFIQEAARTMNVLDGQRDIDWAELACTKPEPAESSPEETQERVDRAREKAVQEMLRQRERKERREQSD